MSAPLLERYRDRIVITGTLPGACHAAGMTSYLNAHHIRIFDSPRFAELLRNRIRANAEKLAVDAGAKIAQQPIFNRFLLGYGAKNRA